MYFADRLCSVRHKGVYNMTSKEFYQIVKDELKPSLKERGFKILSNGAKWECEHNKQRVVLSVHLDWNGWSDYSGGKFIYRFEIFDSAIDSWGNAVRSYDYRPDTSRMDNDDLKNALAILRRVVKKMKPFKDEPSLVDLKDYLRQYGHGSHWDEKKLAKESWFIFYDRQDVIDWLDLSKTKMLDSLADSIEQNVR